MKRPKRLFGNRPDPEDREPELPHGRLFADVYDAANKHKRQEFLDEISAADIVVGRNARTGVETLYFGIAQAKRILRRHEPEHAGVLAVEVDPETDDVEVLCALVTVAKGAHCYTAFSEA
jgi:hypothetical protein